MPKLAIIADDLTGASDTGAQFCKRGLRTSVFFEGSNRSFPHDADVVVVNTDSRAVPAAEAGRRVEQACLLFADKDIGGLYKKIDSTLRGNIGSEILAAWKTFRPVATVIAPAYPQTGRTTAGGCQLLAGVPVSQTEMARDLQAPATEAFIPRLLPGEAAGRAAVIPLDTVRAGAAPIRRAMRKYLAAGADWLICDAASDENLRHIAEAAAPFGRVLWVGSAGLAEQVALAVGGAGQVAATAGAFSCRAVLVVAGSVSAVTQKQIEYYTGRASVRHILLDPLAAVKAPLEESRRIAEAAGPLLERERIVLSCPNDRQMIEAAVEAGKSKGMAVREVSESIAAVLAVATAVLARQGVDGLFLTGGETAVSCCRALGATGIDLYREVVPGIPVGRLIGGQFAGLPVVTKAGAFGGPRAIADAVGVLMGQRLA